MSENTPPLPQPSGATCPNCGAAQEAKAPFCTNCGALLQAATPSSSLSSVSKMWLSAGLGCGALLFGAVGGCFAFLGRIEGGSYDPTFLLFIGVPFLLVIACIWGIFKIQRQ